MPDETAPPASARPSARVWFVVACAVCVIVFLALTLPGVFDVKHSDKRIDISKPVKRLVFVNKGFGKLDISPSADGRVHIRRSSEISRDSRLIEHVDVVGKTLYIRASCTGSRLGVLRRCDLNYHLRLPRKIDLSLRAHIGTATIKGIHGQIIYKSDAGDFDGSSCSKRAYFSLGFGRLRYKDSCTPALVEGHGRAGDIELTVPAGRYDVNAHSPSNGVKRPFANIIEDPLAPNRIDLELHWGGKITIQGTTP